MWVGFLHSGLGLLYIYIHIYISHARTHNRHFVTSHLLKIVNFFRCSSESCQRLSTIRVSFGNHQRVFSPVFSLSLPLLFSGFFTAAQIFAGDMVMFGDDNEHADAVSGNETVDDAQNPATSHHDPQPVFDGSEDDDSFLHRKSLVNCHLRCTRRPMKQTRKMEIKDAVKGALSFLPAKSLLKFRSVSKDWNRYISRRPLLAHEQSYRFRGLSGFFLQHSDDNLLRSFVTLNRRCYGVATPILEFLPHLWDKDIAILSSCNGLLLCHVSAGDRSYYVCNPVTRQWKGIPNPGYYLGSKPAIVLAFEPSISNIEANYHIVCAVPLIDQPVVCFEVFSSETRSWSSSSATCVELKDRDFVGNGYYMNGVCYWETEGRRVLAYDLKNEIYAILNLPLESPRDGILARVRGELSYVVGVKEDGEDSIRIYGGGSTEMGLRERVDLGFQPVYGGAPCRVLCCVDDGDAILFLRRKMVFSYKMRDRSLESVCAVELGDDYTMDQSVRYLPYVNSLVPVA